MQSRYRPPTTYNTALLSDVIPDWRRTCARQQLHLGGDSAPQMSLYIAGDIELLHRPTVAIVGARNASPQGQARARRLARELVEAGVVVVSGLAAGIDTAAHQAAIAHGGRTIAVIGTPLDRSFPVENSVLQEEIYQNHLLISPFRNGSRISGKNFPFRNKAMVLLTDATVVVEAAESSGTIHQAAACKEENRLLFFMQSMIDDGPKWAQAFLDDFSMAKALKKTSDILDVLHSV